MKFAFFHHSLRLGSGIDTVITELASRLAKYYDVKVYCFYTDYVVDEYDFQIEVIRSSLTSTTNRISVLAPFLLNKIGDHIAGLERYDFVNTHVFPANYIARKLKNPLKIVTEWTVGPPNLWSSSIKQRLYTKYLVYFGDKVAVQNADLVISSSKFIKEWVEKNYNISPKLLYLDGINFELLDKNKSTADKVLTTYPQLQGKQIILFVGRITDHKNIHTLIESFRILKQKFSDVSLLLVGDYRHYTGYYQRLLKLINDYKLGNDVIFAGVVPWKDLPSYYSACSIYATCTLWEGYLRPEAFAFEKPIICFDVGPNSETVTNEMNGLLIRTDDPSQFAEGMYQLLIDNSRRQRMGEEGYWWAKKNLDFRIITERFKELCENGIRYRSIVKDDYLGGNKR